MKRVLACSEDGLSSLRIGRVLSEGRYTYDIVKNPISQDNLARYDLVIFHSSYRLSGLVSFMERLVLTKTIPVIYITSTIGIGAVRLLLDHPYFVLIEENRIDSELAPALRLVLKFTQEMNKMSQSLRQTETKVESEKLMQKCKKALMENGMSEEEAHRLILKTAMDHHLTKRDACSKILREIHS
jgi:hypothetical protein